MDTPARYDVFISYSRHDQAFARRVCEQLTLAGKACWMDHNNLALGEDWWRSILSAIERSSSFLCLVSRSFQESQPCNDEVLYAKALKKKIVQVLQDDAGTIPGTLEHIKAIPWAPADAPETVAQLVLAVIDRDFDYDRQRRELLAKALEWRQAGRPRGLLLRGGVLADARLLLARCAADRLAVEPQCEFVAAGVSHKRRANALFAAFGACALALLAAALWTRQVARSRAQAAAATALAQSDPVEALALGIAAMHSSGSPEAEAALRSALLASPPSRIFRAGTSTTSAIPLARGKVAVIGDDGQFRICWLDRPGCTAVSNGIEAMAGVVADRRGRWFAAASRRRAWFYDEGGLHPIYQGASAADGDVTAILASADGGVIVLVRSGAPSLLLARGRPQAVPLEADGARPVALAPDGRRIALDVAREGRRYLEVWGVDPALRLTGRISAALPAGAGAAAQFSPDGRTLAFAGEAEAASLWHYEQSAAPLALPHEQSKEDAPWQVLALAFSADGLRLASAGQDRTARIWDVAGGRLRAILRGHTGAIGDVSFSADGMLVATAGADHSARTWSAADGRAIATMRGHVRQVRHARFTPDGMTLVTDGSDGTAGAYPAAFGYPYRSLGGSAGLAGSVEFSPDGSQLLTAGMDGAARLWGLDSPDSTVLQHGAPGQGQALRAAHFSPDGARIATLGADCSVKVWRHGMVESMLRAGAGGHCAGGQASFIDGATLWAGSASGIDSWTLDGAKWNQASAVWRQAVDGFAASPDGRWLAAYGKDGLTLVDRSGQRKDWIIDAPGTVQDAVFSPDSSRLVVLRNAPIVDVWNIGTRQRAGFLIGHRDAVYRAAFNRDGSMLATGSADGSALLWDLATARPVAELTGQAGFANSVAFSRSADRVAVGGTDNVVRMYNCAVCGGADRMLGAATVQLAAIRGARQPQRESERMP